MIHRLQGYSFVLSSSADETDALGADEGEE